jgi:protein phosphatase
MARATFALKYQVACESDIGLVRRSNQDTVASDESAGLYVVCDGMGGAPGGEIASRIAADTFLKVGERELRLSGCHAAAAETALRRAVAAANTAVRARGSFDRSLRGMGTTLVGFRLCGPALTLINVGDSRAYRVRDGVAACLTEDHSFVAEQVRLGTMTEYQAASSSFRSVITRAIGAEKDVSPDVYHHEVDPGDVILLSSDGLTRHVADAEIAGLISHGDDESAPSACHRLIERARERGGSDNITCLVLRVLAAEP